MGKLREFMDGYHAKLSAQAREAFSRHVLRRNTPERWTIQRTYPDGAWDSAYSADIVCMEPGAIVVYGDISIVAFAHGPKTARARLAWLTGPLSSYAMEKARIGMGTGHGEPLAEYNAGAARAWLEDKLAEPETDDNRASSLREALELADEGEESLDYYLWNNGLNDEDHVGIVPSTRLFYAHAAIVRAHELVCEAEDAATGQVG